VNVKNALTIAVAGAGGREHAIIKKLLQCKRAGAIYALPGNAGIERDVPCITIKPVHIAEFTRWCVSHSVDYVVVTPDDPLALGLVDALAAENIPAFGPTQAAAKIESSKAYAKELMRQNNIPTASYQVFTDSARAIEYAKTAAYPLVVKADGLALGKGVSTCGTFEKAQMAICAALEEECFGKSGKTLVIEEFLAGPEVSVLSFCDGRTLVPMVSSMDHKRALDGNRGENTGGMGAIAPNPFYTPEIAALCMERIYMPTVSMLEAAGTPFKGCLYFGLMLTADGPKVIEYNCRFGDPETQAVLPLLESDLLEIMLACTEGRLTQDMVRFSGKAAACVVLASGGYPQNYQTGCPIDGDSEAEKALAAAGGAAYYAGVEQNGGLGKLRTAGGRVLGVGACADTLREALSACYHAAGKIHWQNMHYRRDIGLSAME
jgi:phosphoribosylamine--glycine ligase